MTRQSKHYLLHTPYASIWTLEGAKGRIFQSGAKAFFFFFPTKIHALTGKKAFFEFGIFGSVIETIGNHIP